MHIASNSNVNIPFDRDEEEGRKLGQALLSSLGEREQKRLQIRLLDALGRLSVGRHLTLVGGSALHGVYLHQRWSRILDIEAPHATAIRFRGVARDEGLSLRETGDQAQLVFAAPGTVFPRVQVVLRVFLRPSMAHEAEERNFSLDGEGSTAVRVAPLAELLAMKLALAFKRSQPMDYADLWFGLQEGEGTLEALHDMLHDPAWNRGSFTPPRPFMSAPVLQGLRRVRDAWNVSLSPLLVSVPSFEQVENDLNDWLIKM